MSELIITERSNIVAIADAVRSKTGETNDLNLGEIINGINSIGTGGLDTSDATATSSDILFNKTAYVNGLKITGEIQSQEAKTITPSTTSQVAVNAGMYTSGAVTVEAIPNDYVKPSGTLNITTNGTHDVKNYASASVNVEGVTVPTTITAGDTPVLCSSTLAYTCTATSMTNTGISITVPRAGTYRFKFSCGRTNTSGTWTAQLYKNGSAVSRATATWNQYQGTYNGTVTCNANDTIAIYARSRGSSYRAIIGQLVACIEWDTGF